MIRLSRSTPVGCCALAMLWLALWPAAATGQAIEIPGALQGPSLLEGLEGVPKQQVAPLTERTFGTQAETAYVVHSADFETTSSAAVWGITNTIDPSTGSIVRNADGIVGWLGPARLPSGAEVTRLEVSACDFSATQEVRFMLLDTSSPVGVSGTGNRLVTTIATTGAAAVPNCAVFSTPVTAAPVSNANRYYAVFLVTTGPDVRFDVARVFYRLKVSPAPAVASFTDVPPSHPFFQFVEALKASGITSGCTLTLYCIDDPITRGEMAVFLSKGLGLHFAP